MTETSYGRFCPVALAAEILCTRWTMLVVRELVCGSRRFNDLRRGVPRLSPALLSRRLKELEEAGIVCRIASRSDPGVLEYELTKAGCDLAPIVESLGFRGHKWVRITTGARASKEGNLTFTGDAQLSNDMQTWLGLSVFAQERRKATA